MVNANPRGASTTLAVCWFDILLLTVVLASASALWTGARRGVVWLRQHHQPEQVAFDRREDGPLKRAELAAAEKERDAVHGAQMDAQVAIARLTAELQAEARNPPGGMHAAALAQRTEEQRQRQVKLDTASLVAKLLAAEATTKLRRVVEAGDAVAEAARLAEMQYADAKQGFDIQTRLWTIAVGGAAWIVLLFAAEICVRFGGRWVGRCHRRFVMIPAAAALCALAAYELLK